VELFTSAPATSTLKTISDSATTTGGGVGGVGVGLSPPLLHPARKNILEAKAKMHILLRTILILFINYNLTILN
jgi:hypothetical protein